MSYYGAGDYYGSGGLFSAIGGAIKGIARVAAPIVGGIVGGPLGGAVGGAVSSRLGGGGTSIVPYRPPASLPAINTGIGLPGTSLRIHPGALLPGGAPAFTRDAQPMVPRGYHLNKSGYFLKSGQYVAPGTKYVKNRSRNFANGRALNRAIGRVAGFERMVKRSRKSLRGLAKI